MTFTYKLAQRLARLKHRTAIAAMVAVATIFSCELPVRSTGSGSSITQLVVAPKNVTLQPNQTYDFVAVGFTATGDSADVSVTWSASNGSVTSSSSGKRHYGHYHNGSCGVFNLAAKSSPGNLSDTATVTVTGCTVPVASVSVSPASATVAAGQSVQLTATPKDANGNPLSGRTVTWSSNNTSVAIADVNGNVTAIAAGSATITATSEGQSGTAAITVTNVPVASVTVTPASASIQQGQTIQLTATPKDANGNALTGRVVTWSSSNTAVASVNAGGFVTSGAAGSATITAASEGKSGTAAITVTSVPVASVTVSPAPGSVQAGQTLQLTATPKDVNGNPLTGRTITWSSSNTSVATVSASGLVTGVVAGSATITATSEGQSGTSAITVTPPSSTCPTSSTAFQNSAFTSQNGSFTATFDATPNGTGLDVATGLSQGAAAAYTDLAVIVRFNTGGTIDARNGGAYAATNSIAYTAGTSYHFRVVVDVSSHTYSVYVTPAGGAEQTIGTGFAFRTEQSGVTALANWALTAITGTHTVCNFAITGSQPPAPVATVTLTPASATVNEGQTLQLTATLKDANGNVLIGRSITWSSSTSSAATVNGTGLVTGVAAGSTTITATSEGQSGTSAITVVHLPVASVTVTPASGTVSAGSSLQLTATPKDANGNPLVGRTVTWQSSNTAAATVNGSGLVSGVAAGSATITATSEGQSGTSAITVTAPSASVVLVGAGDIADCTTGEPTAKLLDNIAGTVFTAGDNAYTNGTVSEFATCYDPSWGRHKARTRPAPGNHDYGTSGATGYYNYFGALAGPAGLGYYSYDLGAWHIISLNSNVSMSAGSAQEVWLRADLAASTKTCTIAYWHHPRFSSGASHGSSTMSAGAFQALYDAGADIVIVGHDHEYERFAPQTPGAAPDPVRGIREFVVGTGGAGLYSFATPLPNSEVRDNTSHGVLKLTLSDGSYTWQFIPVAGDSFTDSGSGTCH